METNTKLIFFKYETAKVYKIDMCLQLWFSEAEVFVMEKLTSISHFHLAEGAQITRLLFALKLDLHLQWEPRVGQKGKENLV